MHSCICMQTRGLAAAQLGPWTHTAGMPPAGSAASSCTLLAVHVHVPHSSRGSTKPQSHTQGPPQAPQISLELIDQQATPRRTASAAASRSWGCMHTSVLAAHTLLSHPLPVKHHPAQRTMVCLCETCNT
jgi:hypothetical protein